jgi:hypothetical protein
MKSFEPGQIVMTRDVADLAFKDREFEEYIIDCVRRHLSGDWGDIDYLDWNENDLSVDGEFRLLSAYKNKVRKDGSHLPVVWVITEADRSSTCVLFPDNY